MTNELAFQQPSVQELAFRRRLPAGWSLAFVQVGTGADAVPGIKFTKADAAPHFTLAPVFDEANGARFTLTDSKGRVLRDSLPSWAAVVAALNVAVKEFGEIDAFYAKQAEQAAATIPTFVNAYCFNINDARQAEEYRALTRKLRGFGLSCFESLGGTPHYVTGQKLLGVEIQLETKQVFNNQWNTAPVVGVSDRGLRVFDWAQDYRPNGDTHIKRGYWLTPSAVMARVRDNTAACGYCGKQEPQAKGYVFCPHCLGSVHLTREILHLTRMQRVSDGSNRAELTEAEAANLVPVWVEAKMHVVDAQSMAYFDKKRIAVIAKADADIATATAERDGMLWLVDNRIRLENVIFYSHTGRFCFGWREKLDEDALHGILAVISEFEFPYDIKCADGRVLSVN